VGTYFDNRFRDQIEFLSSSPTFSPDGVPDYINIAGSKARGVELEVALLRAIGGIAAMGNYSLVDTEVAETIQTGVQFQPGQPLLRRPKHSGTLRVSYARGIASVYFDARFVGQRHDSSFLSLRSVPNATLPRAVTTDITVNPGYAVAGVGIDLRAHRTLTVFVRANNVADTEYESALGYPGMPRTVMLGARFGFGLR
jgi:outer membrane receptor protein involved in Fe transport